MCAMLHTVAACITPQYVTIHMYWPSSGVNVPIMTSSTHFHTSALSPLHSACVHIYMTCLVVSHHDSVNAICGTVYNSYQIWISQRNSRNPLHQPGPPRQIWLPDVIDHSPGCHSAALQLLKCFAAVAVTVWISCQIWISSRNTRSRFDKYVHNSTSFSPISKRLSPLDSAYFYWPCTILL
jgi:hypothetical protein